MSVISSGTVNVSSGVTSTGLEVVQTGMLHVKNGGWAENISAADGGSVVVSKGGILYICTLTGGTATVLNGGWAETVSVENGGLYLLSSGASTHNTLISNGGSARVGKDVMATGMTVLDGGVLHVDPAGYARAPVVSQGGAVHVSLGGIVDKARINGAVFVSSGGSFNSSTVGSGAEVTVAAGGICSNVQIQGGTLSMEPGALASGTVVDSGGQFMLLGTDGNGGSSSSVSSGVVKETTVNAGGTMIVSGGVASNATVNSGGMMAILGGTATVVRENGGYIEVADGANVAFAANTIQSLSWENGSATVHSGTTALGCTVGAGASVAVFSGGMADGATVNAGGTMAVLDGGTATVVRENGGYVEVADGANVTFAANAFSGLVLGDGRRATVHSGTTATDFEVGADGVLHVFSGGTLGGKMALEEGAGVSVDAGGEVSFDLTGVPAGSETLVNDISVIQGTPLYTLTVDAELSSGIYNYALAGGADGFDAVISVYRGYGGEPVSVSVGEIVFIGKTSYLLSILESVLTMNVTIDLIPPTVSDVQASTMAPTNQDVTVTAVFSDNIALASSLYRIGEDGEWLDYEDGVTVSENASIYFRAVDTFANESEIVTYEVTNIDKVAPVITLTADTQTPLREALLTAGTDKAGLDIFYSTDQAAWTLYDGVITVLANGTYYFKTTDAAGNSGTAEIVFTNILPAAPENLSGTKDGVSWDPNGAPQCIVEYSTDHFEHAIRIGTAAAAMDLFDLAPGAYQWRVRAADRDVWSTGEDIVSDNDPGTPQVVQSDEDGIGDVFFAVPDGVWGGGDRFMFLTMHCGSVNDWGGTHELVVIDGKSRFHDLFFGSTDPNILYLTDGENGDAIFIEDVYTVLPETVEEQQSRLAMIREIRTGAGDDIVDMTSQMFEYTGEGLTIRGGGNDTIWANKGDNFLFGDAGNDRIVGASGNDVIAGGTGNDSMHGGGGHDIFTFCENWGVDSVEQIAGGTVTLWFVDGDESNWDASTLTYSDGGNSVTVSGIGAGDILLAFGGSGDPEWFAALAETGAFDGFSSERIFEGPDAGILAVL